MKRSNSFMQLSAITLALGPVLSFAEDTKPTIPPNITIICSPGYAYNQPVQASPPTPATSTPAPARPISGGNISDKMKMQAYDFWGIKIPEFLPIPPPLPIPIPLPNPVPHSVPNPIDLLPGGKALSNLPTWEQVFGNHSDSDPFKNAVTAAATLVDGETKRQIDVIKKTVDNATRTFVKAVNDVASTYDKAWKDIGAQAQRSFNDLTEAGAAIVHFAGNELSSQYALLNKAENQIKEGKIIDAIWSTTVAPFHDSEKNLYDAMQESHVLDQAITSAAAFYGGPAGAAAVAAWKVMRLTGDINSALRAGALAAVVQQGGAIVNGMPDGTISEVVKKAAIAGAVGGVAVAVSGGDEQAITDAFLKSSGNVLIQDAQSQVGEIVKGNPNISAAAETVGCISARNVSCLADVPYVKDATGKLTEQVSPALADIKGRVDEVTGKWTAMKTQAEKDVNEWLTSIPKLPGLDAIPIANNTAVITWTLGKEDELKNGIPTVVITAIGDNVPFISKATYTQIQK
ncbi:hypothetical protein MXL92_07985 [Raoultella ornithinolytica]|uniref:hypothetical protein n=1 Tax=Raoultella ornithinolytica TaxID=54291 RepID=UPI002DB6C3B6|nr:hypothetical protein [Raoultella ornithinolytica]MEB6461166.1 hypothetical protein [Raoultella ornithinolytica]